MAGCLLRTGNKGFDARAFLSGSSLEAIAVHDTGFNVAVSSSEATFPEQIKDALQFLRANHAELTRLSAFPGFKDADLDFGDWKNDGPVQSARFPSRLVEAAAGLGINLIVTFYEASDV